MKKVARSRIGRNMWAILKAFKVLPNDPLIRNMDVLTQDYILEELEYDNEIQAKIAKGIDPSKEIEDDEFSKIYNSKDRHVKLLADGDNLDDIYSQVRSITKDKNYDKRLDSRIKKAIKNKELQKEHSDLIIKDNLNKLDELEEKLKAKNKGK